MNPINSLLASTLIAVTLFAIPLAHADVIYTYTGEDFTNVDGNVFTTSDFITATLVYASLLPASTISTTAPISWTMSAGPLTLTSATTDSYTAGTLTISITTDTTGAIENWDLSAIGPVTSLFPPTNSTLDTIPGFDGADYPLEGGDGENFNTPGTWTFRTGVPEPSSFALLGAGLAGLFTWLAWENRRRRKADR